MATTTTNPYLEQYLQYEQLALDEQKKQAKLQADASLSAAQQTQIASNRGATSDYRTAINPYGVQAEQIASKGLQNSGLSETAKSRAYSAYQGRIGQAANTYASNQTDINNTLAGQQSNIAAQKNSLYADYYTRAYESYLNDRGYNEDQRRYDQDYAENKRRYDQEYADSKKNTSSSSSSTTKKSTTSNNNDNTYKYNPNEFVDINTAYSRSKESGLSTAEKNYWYNVYILMKSSASTNRNSTTLS